MNWVFLLLLWWYPSGDAPPENILTLEQKDTLAIPIMDYDALRSMLWQQDDTTYVFNFWATWCLPCVKELPYFIQLDSMYKDQAFKLVFVSLDFKKDYLKKLQPFVKEKGIAGQVVILEDNRSDYWINDIDASWGGSIPATLVFKRDRRAFYERTFRDVNELSDIVEPFLNQ